MSENSSIVVQRSDRRWRQSLVIAVVLFATTTLVYSSAWNNDFVEWDDQIYVYDQPRVLDGIRFAGLLWAMTASVCANWHPLTIISLQLDAQLFGPGPFGFHLTSVLLHAANSALAFYAIFMITGCRWKSLIVAALFALHPMRVESVAWISERKDVLSGFFFFLTLIAYARYIRLQSFNRYLLVAFCLALGLCSKSMLVTTPCVLLLLDFWPLDRFRDSSGGQMSRFGSLVLEKLPLFGLSVVASILTSVYQKIAILQFAQVPLWSRPENAIRGCAAYLTQTCFPTNLSHFYPIPESSIVEFFASSLALVALTAIAFWQRTRRPYLIVGWLWFLGMLVPVSGLIQVGFQHRADRYTYLAQVGLFLALVWGVSEVAKRSRLATIVSTCLIVLLLAGCSVWTVEQIQVWRNSKSLWRHAYRMDPKNRPALFSLISFAFDEGNRDQAIQFADELIVLEDDRSHDFLLRVCGILTDHDEHEASIRALSKALLIGPNADLFLLRGETFAMLDRWEDAVNDYLQVVQLSPNAIPLYFCLAHALAKTGRQAESNQISAAALQRFPRWPESAAKNASKICESPNSKARDRFKAICLAEEANAVTGGRRWEFLDLLAMTYAAAGQFEKAITIAELALQRAEGEGNTAPAANLRSRIELYRNQLHGIEKKSF